MTISPILESPDVAQPNDYILGLPEFLRQRMGQTDTVAGGQAKQADCLRLGTLNRCLFPKADSWNNDLHCPRQSAWAWAAVADGLSCIAR